jgi:hypothetical protein
MSQNMDKKEVLEVLLKDYELMRQQASKIVDSYWIFATFILSIGSFFVANTIQWVVLIVPFIILAQLAAILHYHCAYIYLTKAYIENIELKINALFESKNILEYEHRFVPEYFKSYKLAKIGFIIRFIIALVIIFPSIVIYGFSLYKSCNYLLSNKFISVSFIPYIVVLAALPIIFFGLVFCCYFFKLQSNLGDLNNKSIEEFNKKQCNDDKAK